MDTLDNIVAESHSARMYAIVESALRYAQFATKRRGFNLAHEQQDAIGYTTIPDLTDGDYENAADWLDSVSDVSTNLTPCSPADTN